MKARYALRVDFKEVRAEIWVNDIPLTLIEHPAGSPISVPINDYLVQGRNSFAVTLHAAPVASRSREPWTDSPLAASYAGQEGKLSIGVAQYATSQPVLAERAPQMEQIDWEGVTAARPLHLEKSFVAHIDFGPWAWESATPQPSLTDAVRQGALGYLRQLHGLLQKENFAGFLDEIRTKMTESTWLAYEQPLEPIRAGVLERLQQLKSQGFDLQPLPGPETDMRLVAGGRLVQCLTADRHHVLEYRQKDDPEERVAFPTLLGQVGGHWRNLR